MCAERAKEVLLQRLEATELQMMTMMRSDYNNEAKQSFSQDSQRRNDDSHGEGLVSAGLADDTLVASLVEAKVALAEKEFETMELVGKLRSKEAYIEALATRLAAANAGVPARQLPGGSGLVGTPRVHPTISPSHSSASAPTGRNDAYTKTVTTPDSHAFCKPASSSRATSAATPNKNISQDGAVVHVYAQC